MLFSCCGLLYDLGVAGVPSGGARPFDLSGWLNHNYFLASCMTGNCVTRGRYHGVNLLPVPLQFL